MRKNKKTAGSILFWLFASLFLFGALAYAFMQGTRSNLSLISGEQQKAQLTTAADCANSIKAATMRLKTRGCGIMISDKADGSNPNTGAPTDGSCSIFHSNGGGVSPTCAAPSCDLANLQIGEACDGIFYVGSSPSGDRLYSNLTNVGPLTYNSSGSSVYLSGAESHVDGKSNTDFLVARTGTGAPHPAAQACRNLGAEWYLPSWLEAATLVSSHSAGKITLDTSRDSWTSTSNVNAWSYAYRPPSSSLVRSRTLSNNVYCVRK